MLGFESMFKEMLGFDVEEIKARMEQAGAEAKQTVTAILNNQNVTIEGMRLILHKQTRIEKMLEGIMEKNGLEIPPKETDANGRITGSH